MVKKIIKVILIGDFCKSQYALVMRIQRGAGLVIEKGAT